MTALLSLAVLAFLLLLVGLMGMWLMRGRRSQPAKASGFGASWLNSDSRVAWSTNAESPASSRSSFSGADSQELESDPGPETVISFLEVTDGGGSDLLQQDAWREQAHSDFASSTLAQPLADLESGASLQGVDPESIKRIHRALQELGEGPVDQAWETLRGFIPESAHRQAAMETFERIALAFERQSRYGAARDVYEHMADIDPQWRQVKLRLMRARGLAQSAASNTWGTVPPRPMPKVNQRELGKYLLERQIGRGAMGAVYLGYDPATDRQVALKTMALAQEFQGDELADARSRFLREAEMAGRLQHPDIVSIIDAGEQDGLAFIAMELIEGIDLSHHAHPSRLLPVRQLLFIMARVADALAYAHTRGVTHRDVKPANIMIDLQRGRVKVMDFGVARVADAARTRTGVVLGTPTFMSPEQLSGQTIDGRSDLYSLGVSLFQLLTGQLPYRNDSMSVLMRAIAHDQAPNVCVLRPDVPEAVGNIVALALEKHPTTRYASGEQMASDLRAVAMTMQQIDIELG